MRTWILIFVFLAGCASKSGAPAVDTGATSPTDTGSVPSPPGEDSKGVPPSDTNIDSSPPAPVEKVGLYAPVEGPFVYGNRHYYIGKDDAVYDPENPVGTLYLLHGLGASGCDFIDRYGPAQFVLEAMALGKPVVATKVGALGADDVIADEKEAFLVRPHDSKVIANRISLLIEDDRARERMGAAARARVEKDYTAETITRKLESIWASLAN